MGKRLKKAKSYALGVCSNSPLCLGIVMPIKKKTSVGISHTEVFLLNYAMKLSAILSISEACFNVAAAAPPVFIKSIAAAATVIP